MAVKFEFTLSDTDAANLIDILHQGQVQAQAQASKFIKPKMTAADEANASWYTKHAEYLEGLKQQVLAGNTRVD